MNQNYEKPDIIKYSEEVAKNHNACQKKDDYSDLDKFPLQKSQCIYILNWSIPALTFTKGIKECLGYEPDEFDLEKALSFIHPDDLDSANRITMATVNHITKHPNDADVSLNITYRIRKKNGDYIKVLRQSGLYFRDEQGNMLENFSLLTDISFMNHGNMVDWEIKGNELDAEAFRKDIYAAFQDLFSKREIQIICGIHRGMNSREISNHLYISEHTVKTHRKNILRKAKCQPQELIEFCIKNGIL